MGRFAGLLGLLTMLGLAYLFSTDRKSIRLKTVLWGLGLQLSFAFFVLKFEVGRSIFETAGFYVNKLLSYSYVGSELSSVKSARKFLPSAFPLPFRFCRQSSSSPHFLRFSTTSA